MENPLVGFHFFVEVAGPIASAVAALSLFELFGSHDNFDEADQDALADVQFLDAEGRHAPFCKQ